MQHPPPSLSVLPANASATLHPPPPVHILPQLTNQTTNHSIGLDNLLSSMTNIHTSNPQNNITTQPQHQSSLTEIYRQQEQRSVELFYDPSSLLIMGKVSLFGSMILSPDFDQQKKKK